MALQWIIHKTKLEIIQSVSSWSIWWFQRPITYNNQLADVLLIELKTFKNFLVSLHPQFCSPIEARYKVVEYAHFLISILIVHCWCSLSSLGTLTHAVMLICSPTFGVKESRWGRLQRQAQDGVRKRWYTPPSTVSSFCPGWKWF